MEGGREEKGVLVLIDMRKKGQEKEGGKRRVKKLLFKIC